MEVDLNEYLNKKKNLKDDRSSFDGSSANTENNATSKQTTPPDISQKNGESLYRTPDDFSLGFDENLDKDSSPEKTNQVTSPNIETPSDNLQQTNQAERTQTSQAPSIDLETPSDNLQQEDQAEQTQTSQAQSPVLETPSDNLQLEDSAEQTQTSQAPSIDLETPSDNLQQTNQVERTQTSQAPSPELDTQVDNLQQTNQAKQTQTNQPKDTKGETPAVNGDKTSKEEGEVNRDENVFNPEDFKKIEEREQGFFSKLFNKEKKGTEQEKKEEVDDTIVLTQKQLSKKMSKIDKSIENQNIETSKIGSKIDMLNQQKSETDERIQALNEKIGELRSTVLGRERVFNKMEDEFTNVKYTVNTFKPENLEKRFNNVNAELTKISSAIEKIQSKTDMTDKKLANFSEIMQKIKSYENVINELENMKAVEEKIKKMKLEIEKATSKSEVMIQNLKESVSKINKAYTTSLSNQNAVKDIMKSLTNIEARLEFTVKKEDFDYVKDDVDTIKKTMFETELNK
ncbi:MAG: hypothetical protein ACOCQG_00440 [Candidatus Nanoarchaeia archaeon]